jgi:alpha-beta hydrolase superfamily lysophospholipase
MSIMAQNRRRKRFNKLIYVILGSYIMVGSLLFFLQERLLFFPTKLEQNYKFEFLEPHDELFLKAKDGAQLNAIHFKAKNPKGIILYFHGNAGDLQRWGDITKHFTQYNYDVLVMDYRTFGKSMGRLSETALYEDAQLFYEYVSKLYSEDEIILYGRSLGTGIATKIASENNVEQLILETPYNSIGDVAKHRFPVFPVNLLLNYQIPTFKFIQKVDCPVTIIHGTEDRVVPYKFGKKLDELNLKNVKFITIEGGAHNNLNDYAIYHSTISELLQ